MSFIIGLLMGLIFWFWHHPMKIGGRRKHSEKYEKGFRVIGKTEDGRDIGVKELEVYIFNQEKNRWERLEDADL